MKASVVAQALETLHLPALRLVEGMPFKVESVPGAMELRFRNGDSELTEVLPIFVAAARTMDFQTRFEWAKNRFDPPALGVIAAGSGVYHLDGYPEDKGEIEQRDDRLFALALLLYVKRRLGAETGGPLLESGLEETFDWFGTDPDRKDYFSKVMVLSMKPDLLSTLGMCAVLKLALGQQ